MDIIKTDYNSFENVWRFFSCQKNKIIWFSKIIADLTQITDYQFILSKIYVLNKLDSIYKKQLSFHQAQLNRYAKAAELRRLSGRHQNQINKMGSKWKEAIDKGIILYFKERYLKKIES